MHLDLAPTLLVQPLNPRKSVLPHAKPDRPRHEDRMVPTNSYGFAKEFNARNPVDLSFADSYAELAARNEGVVAKAPSEDVPDHSSKAGGKSTMVVALQFVKRFTYLRYRSRKSWRMPPSVMTSCFALEAARPGRSLSAALGETVNHMLDRLEAAQDRNELIDVRNPADAEDRFTDRWPATWDDQDLFLDDLRYLKARLALFLHPGTPLELRGEILEDLFGETPGREAVLDFAREEGRRGPPTRVSVAGPAIVGSLSALTPRVVAAKPTPTPAHTFYGAPWPK